MAWIFKRCDGEVTAKDPTIGRLPKIPEFDLQGLEIGEQDVLELLTADSAEWRSELESIRKHFEQFDERLPKQLGAEVDALASRLK